MPLTIKESEKLIQHLETKGRMVKTTRLLEEPKSIGKIERL